MKITRSALTLIAFMGTTKSKILKMVEVDARIEPKFDTTSISLVGDDDLDVVEKNLKNASDV